MARVLEMRTPLHSAAVDSDDDVPEVMTERGAMASFGSRIMNPEDEVADIFGDFDDDNDDDVADILSQGDYDGEHDAPVGERGDEPCSKRQRSGSLSATRALRLSNSSCSGQ